MESRRNVLYSATERCPAINFTRVGSILCAALFAMGLSGFASAQLPLFLAHKFVDSRANGNGNIGVTQDEKSLNYYVLDFSNTNTVHEFDRTGKALTRKHDWSITTPSSWPM